MTVTEWLKLDECISKCRKVANLKQFNFLFKNSIIEGWQPSILNDILKCTHLLLYRTG